MVRTCERAPAAALDARRVAELLHERQHPRVLELPFAPGLGRPERDNLIDQFLRHDVTAAEKAAWGSLFAGKPQQLSPEEKRLWMAGLTGVACGSDAFFPFRDSIDRAAASGVTYVLEPGGSARDQEVIAAANEYGMTMVFSGVRLFHH